MRGFLPAVLLRLAACGSPGDAIRDVPAGTAEGVSAGPGAQAGSALPASSGAERPQETPSFTLRPFHDATGALDSVWVMQAGERTQTLVPPEDAEPPPAEGADLGREDIDFDGVPDIWHLALWGATGNAMYTWWLHDPETGRFRHSPEFSEKIGAHTVDPARKRITVRSNGGHAGAVFSEEVYEVREGRLVEVSSVEQDWLPAEDRYVRKTRLRRGEDIVERVDTLRREELPSPEATEP